ncbi:MAG: hypothetical protein ABIM50_13685 [Novosphingobium sp.]
MSVKPISAEEFDRRFDDGEDMADYIDWNSVRRAHPSSAHLELDVPKPMADWLDEQAKQAGMSRAELVRKWLFERFDAAA